MINLGTSTISSIYLGDTKLTKVYLGTDMVYEESGGLTEIPYYGFGDNMEDSFYSGIEGSLWTEGGNTYYLDSEGTIYAYAGYYCILKGSTPYNSLYIKVE